MALGMLVSTAQAGELVTRIYSVERAELDSGAYEVLSTVDGRVYSVSNSHAVASLREAERTGFPVLLHLAADQDTILHVASLSAQDSRLYRDDFSTTEEMQEKLLYPLPTTYRPTIHRSDEEVMRLFQAMTTRTRGGSQCYQRANYWARHLQHDFGTQSMKVFLFHTAAYRSMDPPPGEPRHRWWFHVAPMVYQQMPNGDIEERVLDRGWPRTIRGPLDTHAWSNVFIDTHKRCRVIDSYQAVLDDQAEWRRDRRRVRREAASRDHCLLRIVPMYYYQPLDVQALDLGGRNQGTWSGFSIRNDQCAVNFCWSEIF